MICRIHVVRFAPPFHSSRSYSDTLVRLGRFSDIFVGRYEDDVDRGDPLSRATRAAPAQAGTMGTPMWSSSGDVDICVGLRADDRSRARAP
jgi:hypothetical protein